MLKCFLDANMMPTKFFKESVEFLGSIVTKCGAKTNNE